MPEAIDTSTARPEASETFIAKVWRFATGLDGYPRYTGEEPRA